MRYTIHNPFIIPCLYIYIGWYNEAIHSPQYIYIFTYRFHPTPEPWCLYVRVHTVHTVHYTYTFLENRTAAHLDNEETAINTNCTCVQLLIADSHETFLIYIYTRKRCHVTFCKLWMYIVLVHFMGQPSFISLFNFNNLCKPVF